MAEPASATHSQGLRTMPEQAGVADDAGERLDGEVADAEQDAGGRGEHDAVVLGGPAEARPHDAQGAEAEEPGLEGGHRRNREGGVRAVAGGQRDREQHEADERQREPPPLALADLEAEQAVGHDGQQHEPAGQHDLDDGQRRQRDRADVQDPGAEADEHADGEPALAPQRARRAQRVADVDVAGAAGSAVLVEERQVRGEGAEQREEDSELEAHEDGQRGASIVRCTRCRAIPPPSTTQCTCLTRPLAGPPG